MLIQLDVSLSVIIEGWIFAVSSVMTLAVVDVLVVLFIFFLAGNVLCSLQLLG